MNANQFPQKTISTAVGCWLLTGAFLVLLMILLGGYTRLSHSGLSMVTWKPVTGFIPPQNEADWILEFEAYKTSPEYKLRNYHFSLDEFKKIYWPEFLHRLLGRITGIAFIIPFIYFLIRRKLNHARLKKHLVIIFSLGLLQGFVGWYMVKSGLVDQPAVSHYRLALHLSLALILYSYLFLVSMQILVKKNTPEPNQTSRLGRILFLLLMLVSIQIIYGAFVAGLKAGLFYPTFPKMGSEWIPETVTDSMQKHGIRSFFDSPYVVQFIHRWLGILTLITGVLLFFSSRKPENPSFIRKPVAWIVIFLLTQVMLGILTLINLVPVSLGVLHQAFAVLILTAVLFVYNQLNSAKTIPLFKTSPG